MATIAHLLQGLSYRNMPCRQVTWPVRYFHPASLDDQPSSILRETSCFVCTVHFSNSCPSLGQFLQLFFCSSTFPISLVACLKSHAQDLAPLFQVNLYEDLMAAWISLSRSSAVDISWFPAGMLWGWKEKYTASVLCTRHIILAYYWEETGSRL